MAESLRLQNIQRVDGTVFVQFNDKTGLEFPSVQALRDFAREPPLTRDELKRLLVRDFIRRHADGLWGGASDRRTVTYDETLPTVLAVTV